MFKGLGSAERRILSIIEPGIPLTAGLHEIAAITGKTSSRIVSEILLDAMNAQAEMAAQGRLKIA